MFNGFLGIGIDLTVTHAQGNWSFILRDTTHNPNIFWQVAAKCSQSALDLYHTMYTYILFNLQMDPVMSIRWSVCFAGDLNPKGNTECCWVEKTT